MPARIALLVFVVAGVALADVPSPPRGDNPGCTVEKQRQRGEECRTCEAGIYGSECASLDLEGRGYVQRCSRPGGYRSSSYVYCRAARARALPAGFAGKWRATVYACHGASCINYAEQQLELASDGRFVVTIDFGSLGYSCRTSGTASHDQGWLTWQVAETSCDRPIVGGDTRVRLEKGELLESRPGTRDPAPSSPDKVDVRWQRVGAAPRR